MSLEKLQIINFQCHKKLEIKFDPYVTVITGSSDIGKSSVIRALRWVCQNYPQGESFIKDGAKGALVKLFIDGKEIKRKRGKGQNTYLLDKKVYKAFGSDVPDTIKKTLNLNDVNFANQHDSSFWLSLSAGEVSRQLNSIVDLGIIDSSLSAIGKKVRHTQQTIQICKERLEKAKERKERVNWILEADAGYTKVEAHQKNYQKLHDRASDLQNVIRSSKTHIETRQTASSQGNDIRSVGKLGQNCINLSKKRSTLAAVVRDTKEQEKIVKTDIPDMSKLESTFKKWNATSIKVMNLNSMVQEFKGCKTVLKGKKLDLTIAEQDLHEATEGMCPVCGREM